MVTLSEWGRFLENRAMAEGPRNFALKIIESLGSKVLDMDTGHPRRVPRQEIIDEIVRVASGPMDYEAPEGSLAARKAAARYANYMMGDANGAHFTPDNVAITANGTDAFSLALRATVGNGDKVILVPPFYGPYVSSTKSAGGTTISVPTKAQNKFVPTYDDLMQTYLANPEAKVIVLPAGNPSGAGFTENQARELAEAQNDINKASDGKITFIHDVVYFDLSKGEDFPVYKYLDEEARNNTVQVISASKIMSVTSAAGAIITKHAMFPKVIKEARIIAALSSPIIAQAAFAVGMNLIVDEHEAAVAAGKDPGRHTYIGKLARSYLQQMIYVERGIKRIAQSYGISDTEGDELFAYDPNKALYLLPKLGKLFIGREVPDINIESPVLGDKKLSLREFIGSDTIDNDVHIEKLFLAMGMVKKGGISVIGRPGRIFGLPSEDGYFRFTLTQAEENPVKDRLAIPEKHRQFLGVIDDAMQLLGAERKRPLEIDKGMLSRGI